MIIRLNGEPHEIAAPISVEALLESLAIDPRRVAVEHNLVVIRRPVYATTMLSEGDEVEIVNFVGGGALLKPLHPLASPDRQHRE